MSDNDDGYRKKADELGNAWMEYARTQALGSLAWIESEADDVCDSPIEKLFFVAWSLLQARYEMQGSSWCCDCALVRGPNGDKGAVYEKRDDHDPWKFQPTLPPQLDYFSVQQRIGKYRVDFVLHRLIYQPTVSPKIYRGPHVIVECDGHDYHDRTKEQAQRDKERDRFLQGEGFAVLRFTGSELWRDAMKCAKQAERFIQLRMFEMAGTTAPTNDLCLE